MAEGLQSISIKGILPPRSTVPDEDGGWTPRLGRTVTTSPFSKTDSETTLIEGDLWGDRKPLHAI